MKQAEFIDLVREIEMELFSVKVRQWISKRPKKDQKRFRSIRSEIGMRRADLETQRLTIIADKLEELAPDLEAGIKDLQEELDSLKDFVAIVQLMERGIGVVARIARFALPVA